MTDPLSLSTLTGSALTQGITFLFNQIEALLERRRSRGDDPKTIDGEAVELSRLWGELEPYAQRGNVGVADDKLVVILTDIHASFQRAGLIPHEAKKYEVSQRIQSVSGQAVGFSTNSRKPSGAQVSQEINEVAEQGSITGIRIDSPPR